MGQLSGAVEITLLSIESMRSFDAVTLKVHSMGCHVCAPHVASVAFCETASERQAHMVGRDL